MNLRLPRTVRSIHRVQVIARVLTHHGFGHLVDRFNVHRYVPIPRRWRRQPPPGAERPTAANLGRRLRHVCQELGPTFIKLGQMVSSRPDLFPADIVSELVQLQDNVPPFSSEEARRIIEEDLGAPVEKCFSTFDNVPFASGSIAQVHMATSRPGAGRPARRVVVKIKRPGIEDTVRLDTTILRWVAELAERLGQEFALYRPHMVVDEFERTILREMDFISEAATISQFHEAFRDDPNLRIPEVHWELTGPRVLTLQWLEGRSAQRLLDEDNSELDKRELARRLVLAYVKQFFEMGLFHADPHPGNLLIKPPATIGLVDFGLTGQMDDSLTGHLVAALVAALNREPEVVVEVLADLNALSDQTDRQHLRRDLLAIIDKYYGLPLHRLELQTLFYEFSSLIRRHHVTLPREFVLFGRTLVGIGGICMQLDPQLDLIALTKPRLSVLLMKRFHPARLARYLTISGWHLLNLLKDGPEQLRDISRRLARGQWQLHVRHHNLDELAREIDRASNRLSFGILIAAIVVGSSLIISSGSEFAIFGLNVTMAVVGMVGYLIAAVMGFWLVIAILRSGKLS